MGPKRVVITGAATGIGAETTRRLRADGAHVTALDIARPSDTVDAYLPVDLSDIASIDRAVAGLDGPFDALCNIAGLPPRDGLEAQILKVNFLGLRRFTLGVLDRLAPGASIVNVASLAGQRWRENLDQVKSLMALPDDADTAKFCDAHGIDPVRAYDLSKEAVIVWTMAQTEHLIARDLRMTSVSPAAIATGILDDFKAAFGERATKNIARVGRAGTPEEVAAVIVFLTSPSSGWLKGIDVLIDGGTVAVNQCDALELSPYSDVSG